MNQIKLLNTITNVLRENEEEIKSEFLKAMLMVLFEIFMALIMGIMAFLLFSQQDWTWGIIYILLTLSWFFLMTLEIDELLHKIRSSTIKTALKMRNEITALEVIK